MPWSSTSTSVLFPPNVAGLPYEVFFSLAWQAFDSFLIIPIISISRRAQALMPGLKHAEVVGSWAGCRPQRAEILVNVERREGSGGKPRWLANNYGHGGSGFTFWYGCAVDLADQLEAAMRSSGR